MSYSISARAATKDEVMKAISAELNKVVEHQPVHQKDIAQHLAAAELIIGLMNDDPARDIYASMSGSIWVTEKGVQNASVSVNFSYLERNANGT